MATQAIDHKEGPHEPHFVHIHINHHKFEIPQGPLAIKSMKDWAEISAADEVEQVVNGELKPLADDAVVQIRGEERFISHPRDCGAS